MTSFNRGADLSFVDEVESEGGAYFEGQKRADVFAILKRSGVDSIRLRLWHDPAHGYCGLERTRLMAARIRSAGMRFMLDIHYSDSWADPGKQFKPRAWKDLGFPELVGAVRDYTAAVVRELARHGTLPDIVQIGNEITPGMLWDDGRVGGEAYDTHLQWRNFADLVKAGIAGLRDGAGGRAVAAMIHIDRGGDNEASRRFYDRFARLGVEFDLIGLSYYPWWHGRLEQLSANLEDLATRYEKDIMVVETAYPWTLEPGGARKPNVKSEEQLHPGYAASIEGQAQFLRDLLTTVRQTPHGRGAACTTGSRAGFHRRRAGRSVTKTTGRT